MADEKETLKTPTEPKQDTGSDWLFTGAEIRALHQTGGAFTGQGAGAAPEQEPDRLEALFDSDMPFDLPELGIEESIAAEPPAETEAQTSQIKQRATGMLVAPQALSSEENQEDTEKHIVFALAGTRYCVPMSNILEIAELNYLTPVPNVPDWIVGVTNLRGDILSVIDFRAFLSLAQEEMSDSQRMLVSQTSDGEITTGLLVDHVMGMESIDTKQVLGLRAGVDNRLAPYLKGVHERDEQVLCVIDIEALLRSLENVD